MMNEQIRRRLLVILLLVGFLARFALCWKVGLKQPPQIGSDQWEYDHYTWNFVEGRGYSGYSPDVTDEEGQQIQHPTAYRPPGITVVWAPLYMIFGHRYDVIRLMHCMVSTATIFLVYAIGRRCFDERVGLLAAVGWAVWPIALYYTSELLSEVLGTFWLLVYLLVSLQFAQKPSLDRALIAGVALGMALLSRPSTAFMLPLAGVWVLWLFCGRRRELAKALVIPVMGGLLLVPWTIRNYIVFGRFVPLSTMAGSVLLQSNNRIVITDPDLYGYLIDDNKIPEYRGLLRATNNEVDRDRLAARLAVQWLKDHPHRWWFLFHSKIRRAFTPFLRPHTPPLYRLGTLICWGPVLGLAVVSFFPTWLRCLRLRHPGWLIHLAIVHFIVNAVVFNGYSRYRFPIEGLCLILAAVTVFWAVDWWNQRHPRRAPVPPTDPHCL